MTSSSERAGVYNIYVHNPIKDQFPVSLFLNNNCLKLVFSFNMQCAK